MTSKTTKTTPAAPAVDAATAAQLEADATSKAIGEFILTVARSMPTLQWCKARIRYGVGSTDAQSNPEALTLIVANELHRRDTGRDQWDRFEQMTTQELGEYILAGYNAQLEAVDAEDTKGDPR